MAKRSLFVLLVAVIVLLAARSPMVHADAVDGYCCLCGGCPGAACVLADVKVAGGINVGKACPSACPEGCNRSLLLEGACALHTAAECPLTAPAPALSLWAVVLGMGILGAYGVRRVRRS